MSWANSTKPRDSRASRAMRARVLAEQPVCAVVECTAPSVQDDHIVPWSQRRAHAMTIEQWHARLNHQGLCVPHHAAKTASERQVGRAQSNRHPTQGHPGII